MSVTGGGAVVVSIIDVLIAVVVGVLEVIWRADEAVKIVQKIKSVKLLICFGEELRLSS